MFASQARPFFYFILFYKNLQQTSHNTKTRKNSRKSYSLLAEGIKSGGF